MRALALAGLLLLLAGCSKDPYAHFKGKGVGIHYLEAGFAYGCVTKTSADAITLMITNDGGSSPSGISLGLGAAF